MPTKTGKLTRAEKREINKKVYQEVKEEIRLLTKEKKLVEPITTTGKKTQKEILEENAEEIIKLLSEDYNYKDIASKFRVNVISVCNFVSTSRFSARAREAITYAAEIAFDKAEESIMAIDKDATQAEVTRQRELAHHYRRKAGIKNRGRFGDSTKIQAEVKDTSNTNEWLEEILTKTDKNK